MGSSADGSAASRNALKIHICRRAPIELISNQKEKRMKQNIGGIDDAHQNRVKQRLLIIGTIGVHSLIVSMLNSYCDGSRRL